MSGCKRMVWENNADLIYCNKDIYKKELCEDCYENELESCEEELIAFLNEVEQLENRIKYLKGKMSQTRELAKVGRVFRGKEDHDILTISISMEGVDSGWGQGFGGLCLGDDKLADDFEADIKAIFGVNKLEDLVGKQCYVLRCFDQWNENIEGLESLDGKRFTLTKWRKKHFPETKSPLEDRIDSIHRSISSFTRRINQESDDLKTIRSKYVEW